MSFIPGDIIQASARGLAFSNAGELLSAQKPYPYSVSASTKFGSAAALSLALSPDAGLLVVGSASSPYANIYNASGGDVAAAPGVTPNGSVLGMAFNPAGSLLACAHQSSPNITIYNTSNWSKVPNPAVLPSGSGAACAFNPSGALLAVAHSGSPYITIYNTGDWSKVPDPSTLPSASALSVDFNHDGSLMAVTVSGVGTRMLVYNTATWGVVSLVTALPAISSPKCKFSPLGSYLAYFGGSLNRVYIYDTSTWTILPTSDVGGNVNAGAWLDNTHFVFNAAGLIRVMDVQNNVIVNTHASLGFATAQEFNDIVVIPASPQILSGTVRDVDENGLARRVTAIHAGSGRRVAGTTSADITGEFSMSVWGDDVHSVVCNGVSVEISQVIDATPE